MPRANVRRPRVSAWGIFRCMKRFLWALSMVLLSGGGSVARASGKGVALGLFSEDPGDAWAGERL